MNVLLQRIKGNHKGQNYEYDIIVTNSSEIVIVEVKTTLRQQDVNDFHEKIWKAKTYIPEYKDRIIYGGLAFITLKVQANGWQKIRDFLLSELPAVVLLLSIARISA